MKVLFLSPVRFRSMVGGRYARLAEALLELGVSVSWIEPPLEGVVEGDPVNPPCGHGRFRLHPTPVARGSFFVRVARRERIQAEAVRKAFGGEDPPRALVVFDGGGTVLARREARKRGAALVLDLADRVHLFLENPLLRRLHRAFLARAARGADAVTACSRALVEDVRRWGRECVWIPNAATPGPAPPRRERPPGGPVRMVFAGALEPWVDPAPLVEVLRNSREASLTVAGEGRAREALLGAGIPEERIRFLGRIPYGEVPALLEAHDLGIVPFRVDPLTDAASPLKLFDYWERALPVLSTPFREARETGGVWFYRDAGELAGRLREFAGAPEPFLASGREGRRRVEREFNWRVQGRRFLEVLERAAARASSR